MKRKWKKRLAVGAASLGLIALALVAAVQYAQGSALRGFTNGRLEAADYWSNEPKILSAGVGFDSIIGLPELNEETVRGESGDEPSASMRTSAATTDTIERGYRRPGPEPLPGVRYSAPGPPDLEPVVIALDDPMRLSRTP